MMPSEEQHGWELRMQSVMRQFRNLTSEPVMEASSGQAVEIVGMMRGHGSVRLTVVPAGEIDGVYTTDLDELIL